MPSWGKVSRRLHVPAAGQKVRAAAREALFAVRSVYRRLSKRSGPGATPSVLRSDGSPPGLHEESSESSSDDQSTQTQRQESRRWSSESPRESYDSVAAELTESSEDDNSHSSGLVTRWTHTTRSRNARPAPEGPSPQAHRWSVARSREANVRSGADLPTELLLHILDYSLLCPLQDRRFLEAEIQKRDWGRIGEWNTFHSLRRLRNLALVCRAWYDRVAPFLYSRLHSTDLSTICTALRLSDSRTRGYVMHVTVDAGPSILYTSSRLGQLVPNTLWLKWNGLPGYSESESSAVTATRTRNILAHPAFYTPALCNAHRAFAKVALFDLKRCAFPSSFDLLCLLSSLPALVYVNLDDTSVATVSDRCPRPRATRLRHIHSNISFTDRISTRVPLLVRCFTWCQSPDQHVPSGFAGIPLKEAKAVALFVQLFELSHGSSLILEPPVGDGQTWVIWYKTGILHIEFHAMQDAASAYETAPAHIRQLIVRFKSRQMSFVRSLAERDAQKALTEVVRLLSELTSLEAIIFETQGANASDEEALVVLGNAFRFPVSQRTCQQANRLSMAAKDDESLHHDIPRLVSPFWCQRQFAEERGYWLPRAYWDSLPTADQAE